MEQYIARGPIIGYYLDMPIHEWMQWGSDRLYYKGVAITDSRGNINRKQLTDKEHLVVPGLIYAPCDTIQNKALHAN